MLNCQEVTHRASDYIDGELEFAERLRLRLHLMTCRHCRRFMRQMRATIGLLGNGFEDTSSTPASDELLTAFRSRSGRKSDPERT